MHCIYEVRVTAETAIADEYYSWLKTHLSEVVQAAGFAKGEIYALEDAEPGYKSWVCQYHALNRGQIDSYLRNHAPRLRADGKNRFGELFHAERRILIFQTSTDT